MHSSGNKIPHQLFVDSHCPLFSQFIFYVETLDYQILSLPFSRTEVDIFSDGGHATSTQTALAKLFLLCRCTCGRDEEVEGQVVYRQ